LLKNQDNYYKDNIIKKILFIDLDGIVADFVSAMHAHPLRHSPPYDKDPDTIPGLFRNLKPIKDAVGSVNKLLSSEQYDVYFLSTAPGTIRRLGPISGCFNAAYTMLWAVFYTFVKGFNFSSRGYLLTS